MVFVEKMVDRLRKDLTGGASQTARELAQCLVDTLKEMPGTLEETLDTFDKGAFDLLCAQPFMASNKYVISLCYRTIDQGLASGKDKEGIIVDLIEKLENFITASSNANAEIARNGAIRLAQYKKIFVFTLSGTVMELMGALADLDTSIEIVASEAKPGSEGIEAAKIMSDLGFSVTLMADSAIDLALEDCDYVITGCDAVTSSGYMINKVGTALMAKLAWERRIPVGIATEICKFDYSTLLGYNPVVIQGAKEQIMRTDERYATLSENVRISNPQVDFTPPYVITEYITERGILSPDAFMSLALGDSVSPRFIELIRRLNSDTAYTEARREAF